MAIEMSETMRRVVDMRREGKTLNEIAEAIGKTRQRVSQILLQAQDMGLDVTPARRAAEPPSAPERDRVSPGRRRRRG